MKPCSLGVVFWQPQAKMLRKAGRQALFGQFLLFLQHPPWAETEGGKYNSQPQVSPAQLGYFWANNNEDFRQIYLLQKVCQAHWVGGVVKAMFSRCASCFWLLL